MNLISGQFALLVSVALAVYYLLPHRLQNAWLLVVSYGFYTTLGWSFAVVLAAVTLASFWIAQRIERSANRRRLWLWAGITLNVGVLILFKASEFFVPTLTAVLGIAGGDNVLKILLPVGLSFTVLQCISYLVDVSRGQVPASRNPIDFGLYLAYFPKLTSGPIERARVFLPRLAEPRHVDNATLARAIGLIAIGLVRKVVIADALNSVIPPQFISGPLAPEENALSLAVQLVLYGFQLFNDFAGYTSLVRGISLLFGIELSPNFGTPYFSRSFTEFWSQWHISLTQWLRDYIFFPVSRALLRRNPNPRWLPNILIPPLATMIVSGLWHAISLNTLVWGIMHGVYLAVERLIAVWRPGPPLDRRPMWWQILSGVIVFVLVIAAWLPFRGSLTMVEAYVRALADWSRPVNYLPWPVLWIVIPALALDWVQFRAKDELVFLRWPLAARAGALALAVILVVMTVVQGQIQVFIYQAF